MKVLLILVDGMRPDALADIPQAQRFLSRSACTLEAETVMPSMTLPCHMSLFHSVDPSRHGVTTNHFTPQVRPVRGLCEVLQEQGKSNAFFYNWEELRDLTRPGSLMFSYFFQGELIGYNRANTEISRAAKDYLIQNDTDFAFLYLGYPDVAGHRYGWMSGEYFAALQNSWENIACVTDALPENYTIIITADHGGHDRTHGTDCSEDMTIPLICLGEPFAAGQALGQASIKDIAPTAAVLLGVSPDSEWEGKSLI